VTVRPGWIVAGCLAVALAWITWNTLHTAGPGGRGLPAGTRLPPFAAPLVTSTLVGDANVRVRPRDGHPAACAVRGPRILNSCALAERGPVVLGFFIAGARQCLDEIDALNRLRARFPRVGFAAVAIRGARPGLRAAVRDHGWQLPVGWDRDGAVANAFAVAVCPTITLARRGGVVTRTLLGQQSQRSLERAVARLGA
jgi:AhpC/TSA family